MDDDDYPQFGNAFPSTVPTPSTESRAAWNPAFRPDTTLDAQPEPAQQQPEAHRGDEEDDFFERYPGATPKKQQQLPTPAANAEGEGLHTASLDPSSPVDRRRSISVEHVVEVRKSAASPEDLRRAPESFADAEGPVKRHQHIEEEEEEEEDSAELLEGGNSDDAPEDDEEGAVFAGGAEESVAEQERDLEEYMPDTATEASQEVGEDAEQQQHANTESRSLTAHPESQYEHQGDVTEMEAAQDEEADAPLLEDEEAPPTPGDVDREPTLDLDGESSPRRPASKAQAAPPSIDRSFTTNFMPVPAEETQEQEPLEEPREAAVGSSEWPSAGDDKTFGELLDDGGHVPAQEHARERPHAAQPAAEDWPSNGDDETFGSLLNDKIHDPELESAQQWPEAGDDDAFGDQLGSSGEASPAERSTQRVTATSGLMDVTSPGGTAERAPEPAQEEDLAAAWQAALDDDDMLDESNDLDPSNLFGDDDEGLLGDDDDFLAEPVQQPPQRQQQPQQARSANYRPANPQQPTPQQSPYAGPTSQYLNNPAFSRSGGTPDTGLYDVYNHQPAPAVQAPQRPGIQQTQSFADKSKGGYQSPYDLPMEVVKPRRRPQVQQNASVQHVPAAPAPPPRSSSYAPTGPQSPPMETQPPMGTFAPQASSVSSMSPPTSSHGPPAPPNGLAASARSTPKSDSGFFADLPVPAKPRARPSGAYTPQLGAQSPAIGGPQGRPAGASHTSQPGTPGIPSQAPFAPPQAHPSRGLVAPPAQPPMQQQHRPAPPQQQPSAAYGGLGLGLRQPERMPLLPEQPQPAPPHGQPNGQPQPPAAAPARYSPLQPTSGAPVPSRYSPAPAPTTQPATSRYSPAPSGQPGQMRRQPSAGPPSVGMAKQLPFAPRTSSPLAFGLDKPQPALPAEAVRNLTVSPPRMNGVGPARAAAVQSSLSPDRRGARYSPAEDAATQHAPAQAPVHAQGPPMASHFMPPPRPRTQSPGATMKQPRLAMTAIERPMSAAGAPYAPAPPFSQQPTHQVSTRSAGAILPHRRQFSRDLSFAVPQNETSQDPLERWKGGPIFHWTAGGSIVTSFPKQTPFYAGGHGTPSLKCTAGDIKLEDANTVLPLDERDAKFPGPLTARAKGRKKDVLTWMSGKIEALERGFEGAMLQDFSLPAEVKKRAEEKVVLWKLMRIFVEHDGSLEGKPQIEEEVRNVLLPNLAQMSQVMDLQSPVSAGGGIQAEGVDKQTVVQIRQALLEGQREKAVWLAEEKKLWGHAMLLASTMGPEVWKQIVQSFVRSQVKTVGSDAMSLAALYQIFAGNSEDCVDELVPPSARAGFQMVSRADGAAAGNPLQGLDQWRETLGLVVSNRTGNDGQSLVALGKLLAGYGRPEAAHTCFLFGRSFVKHSGADDGEADFVLLGADHSSHDGTGVGNDLDSILLTEIYEWATSLSAPSTTSPYAPHLQAYKLIHAQTLATHGHKSKAQAYCDHITTAYTSTTRPSQYYHPTFTTAVAELSAFLSQTPQDASGKGGWMGKEARNQVASKTASWFTKFVSGDDDQHQATAAGTSVGGVVSGDEAGPFGRVSGEISRSGSGVELYNPMMMGNGVMPVPSVGTASGAVQASAFTPGSVPGGKYAPSSGSRYAPQQTPSPAFTMGLSPQEGSFVSPTDVTRSLGIPSLEQPQQQRPSSAISARSASSRYAPTMASGLGLHQGLGVPKPELNRAVTDFGVPYGSGSRRGSAQDPGSQGSYEPTPSLVQEPNPYGYQPPAPQQSYAEDVEDAFARPNGVGRPQADFGAGDADAETAGDGYEPPSSGYGYEPPSYQPYQPDPEEEEAPQPRKKGIMDLDDDDDAIAQRAADLKKKQADSETDEVFRKAAEADAARDKQQGGDGKNKPGWFGGWFAGGKKDLGAGGEHQNPNKPIRAKLGDDNSFYYDENLKKWVNKKAGPEAAGTPAAATPPPPRGPPSRVTSGMSGPPSGPPSRVSSGAGMANYAGSRPPTSGSGAMPPGSGPPSRAATPASGGPPESAMPAGLNGDVMGPPSLPPSRPTTSMSTASSLDDLLGAGPLGGGRKAGGTVKGKKKGGRYVDIMAK
ncbi:hypothetical protein LTR36_000420 [Oleoguttula mirabilis]|uniref:Protein transport protein sec16 n=1 Tax=Oleoguttula mirabilis TaxID=1507867 RepID=A0AAV9JYN0_9PEZI|nr:hypothetical protein LTR36_000420 [Oleoguttula mirabilis]